MSNGCNASPDRWQAAETIAFGRLPYAVIRDPKVSAAYLVLFAYRVTFIAFALNVMPLLRNPIVRGGGLGRDVIQALLKAMKANGHLTRWQPGWRKLAREKLTPPPYSKGWLTVWQTWFDAKLSLKEMAAFIFLSAGTGSGKCTYAHELAERFGWHRETTAKVLAALVEYGLVAERRRRARGARYEALLPVLWPQKSGHEAGAFVEKPGEPVCRKTREHTN